jgi:hypothetical protein
MKKEIGMMKKEIKMMKRTTVILATLTIGLSWAAAEPKSDGNNGKTKVGPAEREPANAVAGLSVHEELDAQLFASEPMMLSPSAIDVDHKGRVWVCEVVNYRRHKGKRPEGDRILILEDTDGDAKADKSTVFYQRVDVDSAHRKGNTWPVPNGA